MKNPPPSDAPSPPEEPGSESSEALACPAGSASCPIYDEVSSLKQQIAELHGQLRTDHLTGLFNRRHFLFALEQEIERTHRSHQPTTLLLMDIDHFKLVNDCYGHVAGDRVLSELASQIKFAVRFLDIPCRYGGEEFAILLPSTPLVEGEYVAQRLCQHIAQSPIAIADDQDIEVTVSIGVDSYCHYHRDTAQTFIARVDELLYRAKHQGRNRVCAPSIKARNTGLGLSQEEKGFLFGDEDS